MNLKTLISHCRGFRALPVIAFALALFAQGAIPAKAQPAQDAATGSIQGRVYFPESDRYLENVRVTIEGTNREAHTDQIGSYEFSNVPAGEARVTAYFGGLESKTVTVKVEPAKASIVNIDLVNRAAAAAKDDDVVKLDKFVVSTSREELGSAIALQEQRFATNMKVVVDANEFGENPTGNVGDFMQHLPGVEINSTGNEARSVSMAGSPAQYVPITVGGFGLANAQSGGTARTVELEQVSLNNISRIEANSSVTPEAPGSSLAGYINFVPKSSFEHARPKLNVWTYLSFNSHEFTLSKTPGPTFDPERKTAPSFNFTYIVPLSKKFGFTVSGGYSYESAYKEYLTNTWRGAGSAFATDTVDGAARFPMTDPGNPYLSHHEIQLGSKITKRSSIGLTADWRIARNDRVSFSLDYGYFDAEFGEQWQIFEMQKVTDYSLTKSTGQGYLRQSGAARTKRGTTYMPTITYRHFGPLWKIDAGIGLSHSSNHYDDINNGYFHSAFAERGNVDITFDNIDRFGPNTITVTDRTPPAGVDPNVDYRSLDEYALTRLHSRKTDSYDEKRTAFLNVRRDLTVFGVPFTVKGGLHAVENIRDRTRDTINWWYLGADAQGLSSRNDTNNANTLPMGANVSPHAGDNDAAPFLDTSSSEREMPFGGGKYQTVNWAKLYDYYQAHPEYFQFARDIGDNQRYSQHASETISSAYLLGDTALFNKRLRIIGGARVEQTHVEGYGPSQDNRLGARPFFERANHDEVDFTHWFPSVNANYSFGSNGNFMLRAAWYTSIGRPDFEVYVGEITLPDLDSSPSPTTNRIGLKGGNTQLEPWTAETGKISIEWYLPSGGQLSASALSRRYKNFFIEETTAMTQEIMDQYHLAEEYRAFWVLTKRNSEDTATVTAYDINYKQTLNFLPPWMRSVTVYANATFQDISGPGENNFYPFTSKMFKAGISYARKGFNARADWTYRDRQRNELITGTGIEPDTRVYDHERHTLNASLEFRLTRHFTLTVSGRNLLNTPQTYREVIGPSTPDVAKISHYEIYGPFYTFGLKAEF